MLLIITIVVLACITYYSTGFEQTVNQVLWRLRQIKKFGPRIGSKIVHTDKNHLSYRPITDCIQCTTFWATTLSVIVYWLLLGEFELYYILYILSFTLFSDQLRRLIYVIQEIINNQLHKLNNKFN